MEEFVFEAFADYDAPEGFTITEAARNQVINALKTGSFSADQVARVFLDAIRELEHRILVAESRAGG